MAKRKRESTGDTTGLIPQPHGGALKAGGTPGNHGGRPTSELRRRLRESFAERVSVIEEIADGVVPLREKCPKCGHEPEEKQTAAAATDRLRAVDMLARHGFGPGMPIDEVRQKLKATITFGESMLEGDAADKFRDGLRKIWLGD